MSRVITITYANKAYLNSAKLNIRTAKRIGKVDQAFLYTFADIDAKFYEENKHILLQKKGNGYWLWKPYFILNTLNKMSDGDILLYTDAAMYFVNDVHLVTNRLSTDNDKMFFSLNADRVEAKYTKKDAFIELKCDSEIFADTSQVDASAIILVNNQRNRDFCEEWLHYCCNPQLLMDGTSLKEKEDSRFLMHRHDQSLLSLVAKKHDVKLYIPISQWAKEGIFTDDVIGRGDYPQIVNHHRMGSAKSRLQVLFCQSNFGMKLSYKLYLMKENVTKSSKKWKIYIVGHKKLYDEMVLCDKDFSNEHFCYLNVGDSDTIENSLGYDVIKQTDLSNSTLIGKYWAESEGLYNLWRSGAYKNLDYIGCIHYDVQLKMDQEKVRFCGEGTNITERINKYIRHKERAHVSFATFYPKVDFAMSVMMDPNQPNVCVGNGRNCYYSIIEDYNNFFNTEHTVDEFLKYKKFNLCSCFLIDTVGFDRMMQFFDWLYNSHKLDQYDTNHEYRFQGGMAERYFAVFMLFEYRHMKNMSLLHHYDAGWK